MMKSIEPFEGLLAGAHIRGGYFGGLHPLEIDLDGFVERHFLELRPDAKVRSRGTM